MILKLFFFAEKGDGHKQKKVFSLKSVVGSRKTRDVSSCSFQPINVTAFCTMTTENYSSKTHVAV